jgi:hypothetical protein
MDDPVRQLICEAIARRRLLMFGYGDNVRLVEPHVLGVNTAGREALSGWLRPGYSRSDPNGGWRMFLLSGMRDIGMMSGEFTPRPGYNAEDPQFAEILCHVRGVAAGSEASGEAER